MKKFNFSKNDAGKIGFLVDGDYKKLKSTLETFKHIDLNIFQLGTGQYFLETVDEVKFGDVSSRTHSDAYFIDRKTGRAMMFMLLNGLSERDRTIYLMNRIDPKNEIYSPQILNRRIVEKFNYADLELDVFKPTSVKEIYELKWQKFHELYLKRLEKKVVSKEIEEKKAKAMMKPVRSTRKVLKKGK